MDKVIFLDIDGVLNDNVPYDESKPSHKMECIKVLAKIVKATGARVVLHSGWRRYLDAELHTDESKMKDLLSALHSEGITLSDVTSMSATTDEIIATRKFSKAKPKEIAEYVAKHQVQAYVVLDDLHLRGEKMKRHCFRTNPRTGLVEEDIPEVLRILQ